MQVLASHRPRSVHLLATILRHASSMTASSVQLIAFDQHGDPDKVLSVRTDGDALGEPQADEVQLRILAAPINPSDINTIQGKYPLCPPLPNAVPGHEGVAEVVRTGDQVTHLKPGDWAIPLDAGQGTWRSMGNFKAASWHPVPSNLPLAAAATLCINPPSALCMLEQFTDLQPGDVVAQNGATSAVGQAVIQLARAKGLHTINLIRQRPEWDATVQHLRSLGADVVASEEEAKQVLAAAGLPPPKLGFNCVGGSSATAVAKLLGQGGTLVTYGGMSMQPVTVPTALLIFKDISFRGFWLSGRWARQAGREGRAALMDQLVQYVQAGQLRAPPVVQYGLEQWREAVAEDRKAHKGGKVLLVPGLA